MQVGNNKSLKILIVEDDIVDRKLLERLLSKSTLSVSEVKSAAYLDNALQMLEEDSFDIVLLDLGLPDSTGIESITKIQSVAPHVPIIVLSGLDDQDTAILAVQKGVQDYLIKGQVDSNLLMRSIRYAIERKKTERELQLAEQKYRTIFENSAVAIMMVDEQEQLVSWNEFTEQLLDMTEADLLHYPVKLLYPESEWEKIRTYNVRQKGMQHHLETKMNKKNGDIIDVDVSLSVLKDADGNITGSIGVIRDITDRKVFEEALRKSEERFRQVVDNAQEWIWEVDADGTYTYSSPMVERILGYRLDEILGKKHFYDFFHPEDREQLKQLSFANLAKKEVFYEFKNRNIHKDGHEVWLSTSGVPIIDENQNLIGYRGVDIDITERRRITEILDRKQKNLEAIFDAAPIGMLLINENMTIKRANDAIRRLVQKDFSNIINLLPGSALGCYNCVYNDTECGQSPACDKCLFRKAAKLVVDAQEAVHGLEFQPTLIIDSRQVRPWLSLSAEPVVIDGQKHAVIAINDVTDRKKAEEELKETMEMKSQFISTVSHELRTPLTSMKEAVVIVLDEVAGKINDDQRHFLDIATKNIERLARLINDVLDFQKLGAGKMVFHMQQHDIVKVTKDAYNTMVPYAKKKKVNLTLELQDNLQIATFDSDRIIQVLTNLMSNAIKFTPENGQVLVAVKHQDEQLLISVVDTGMGIPKDELSKIFERFYRVQRPGTEIKGTGLGLAIVNKIVQAHCGRIDVESEVNKGTTFNVYLPFKQEPKTETPPEITDNILEETLHSN